MDLQPSLRPADVAVALSLVRKAEQSYTELTHRLHLSRGAVYNAVVRLQAAMLVLPGTRRVNTPNLREFVLFGVQYAFYAVPGAVTRGVPTGHSAPPLRDEFVSDDELVWPSPQGTLRGHGITPLYPGAPLTTVEDPELYHALAVIDSLRVGNARERERAREWLRRFIGPV